MGVYLSVPTFRVRIARRRHREGRASLASLSPVHTSSRVTATRRRLVRAARTDRASSTKSHAHCRAAARRPLPWRRWLAPPPPARVSVIRVPLSQSMLDEQLITIALNRPLLKHLLGVPVVFSDLEVGEWVLKTVRRSPRSLVCRRSSYQAREARESTRWRSGSPPLFVTHTYTYTHTLTH